jgi:hypothetical protein
VRQTTFPFSLQKNPDPAPVSPFTMKSDLAYFGYSLGLSASDYLFESRRFAPLPLLAGLRSDDCAHEMEIIAMAAMRRIATADCLF